MLSCGEAENSAYGVFRPQLRHDFSRGSAGFVCLVWREADRAYAGMAAAAVTLADLREVRHFVRVGLRPRIRAN